MLRIEISAESVEAFRAHVADLYSMVFGALERQAIPAASPQPDPTVQFMPTKAPKRTRMGAKKAETATVEPAPHAAAPAVTAELTAAGAATTATAEALFGGVQQAPAPVEAPKATQKDLIAAFRALAEAKGTAPVVEIIGKYDVKSVALIPEAKWAGAIALAQAATK